MAINYDKIRWASQDVNDPATGKPNKVEPPSEQKNSGLNKGEPLARAHLNYILQENAEQHQDLQNQIDALVLSTGQAIIEQIYHVGSYYMSNSSQSPADRFGFGNWVRVKGKHIVGVDEGDSSFNAPNKTGGSKNHSHSHNISTNSAGNHAHTVDHEGWGNDHSNSSLDSPSRRGDLVTGSGRAEGTERFESLAHATNDKTTSSSGSHTHSISGGINSSSNLAPYHVAYIWYRVS